MHTNTTSWLYAISIFFNMISCLVYEYIELKCILRIITFTMLCMASLYIVWDSDDDEDDNSLDFTMSIISLYMSFISTIFTILSYIYNSTGCIDYVIYNYDNEKDLSNEKLIHAKRGQIILSDILTALSIIITFITLGIREGIS